MDNPDIIMHRPSVLKRRPPFIDEIDFAHLKLGDDYIIKVHSNPQDPLKFYYGKILYYKDDEQFEDADGYVRFRDLERIVEYPNINNRVPIDTKSREDGFIEEEFIDPYIVESDEGPFWYNFKTREKFWEEPPRKYGFAHFNEIIRYYKISYPDMRDIGSGKRGKSKKMKKSKSNKMRRMKRKTRKY